MAQTFSGATVPYALQADMIVRCDVRTLGDWLSDNNVRLTPTQVTNSTVLYTLLLASSGDVELATYAGQRYSVLDLQALPSPSGQLEMLKDLVCARCVLRLMRRRPHVVAKSPDFVQEALTLLNQLRQGERIFGFIQSAVAGMNVQRLIDGPMIANLGCRWLGGTSPSNPIGPNTGWGYGCGCW